MCYLSNSMSYIQPWCATLTCNMLLYQMYAVGMLSYKMYTVLMCECDIWPCFHRFLSRADGTNQCNHTMKCSSLRNLQLRMMWKCICHPAAQILKKLWFVDKKGANFGKIQPWRNQTLTFLSPSLSGVLSASTFFPLGWYPVSSIPSTSHGTRLSSVF